jgi:hypothetical protein
VTDVLDPTAVALPDLGELPDIGLDTELTNDSQPFLGVMVSDQYEPNFNKTGYQWSYLVRPVDFALKGDTGCFFGRSGSISTNPVSKMGMILKAFKEVRGKEKTKVGKGELVGFTAIWIRRTVSFARPDGTSVDSTLLIPVREATEEEKARAAGVSQVAQDGAAVQAGTPAPSVDLSDQDVVAILGVIAGKTPSEFQMAAISSPLSPDLMNLVLNGKALDILKSKELATLDESGRVVALPF